MADFSTTPTPSSDHSKGTGPEIIPHLAPDHLLKQSSTSSSTESGTTLEPTLTAGPANAKDVLDILSRDSPAPIVSNESIEYPLSDRRNPSGETTALLSLIDDEEKFSVSVTARSTSPSHQLHHRHTHHTQEIENKEDKMLRQGLQERSDGDENGSSTTASYRNKSLQSDSNDDKYGKLSYGSRFKPRQRLELRHLVVGATFLVLALFAINSFLTKGGVEKSYFSKLRENRKEDPSSSPSAESQARAALWDKRQKKVREAFQHAWKAYRRDAWGKDEYHPISRRGSNMLQNGGGYGFTIVDSLDTILIMELEEEFQEARAWVQDKLDFHQDGEVNLFETTIRVLGGLLSAYDLSGRDPLFLDKAVDLADRLMGAFETSSGIPFASVHLKDGRGVPAHSGGISSTSEVSTLQLEFKYLSYLTGDDKYWKVVENVMLKLKDLGTVDGLVPVFIDPYDGDFYGSEIRLGSRGDSYYEYLIKQYLQTAKQEVLYKDMFYHAMEGVKTHLLARSVPNNLLFVGEIYASRPATLITKMDHLVCFLGGTMALGSTEGRSLDNGQLSRSDFSKVESENFLIGEELTRSCYEMYNQTETGLAPEIVYWVQNYEQVEHRREPEYMPGSDFLINNRDGHNWLRPETVESLFYMWRFTGEEKYREWGWKIFEAIEKYSKVEGGGYSSIHDIRRKDKIHFSDKMETFFLAETLKYFYLLFGPNDILPLDKYIFNTEAHPLPIFAPPESLLNPEVTMEGEFQGE